MTCMESPQVLANECWRNLDRDLILEVWIVVAHNAVPFIDVRCVAAIVWKMVVDFAPLNIIRLQPFDGFRRREWSCNGEGSMVFPDIRIMREEKVWIHVSQPAQSWSPTANMTAQQQFKFNRFMRIQGEIGELYLHSVFVIRTEVE